MFTSYSTLCSPLYIYTAYSSVLIRIYKLLDTTQISHIVLPDSPLNMSVSQRDFPTYPAKDLEHLLIIGIAIPSTLIYDPLYFTPDPLLLPSHSLGFIRSVNSKHVHFPASGFAKHPDWRDHSFRQIPSKLVDLSPLLATHNQSVKLGGIGIVLPLQPPHVTACSHRCFRRYASQPARSHHAHLLTW